MSSGGRRIFILGSCVSRDAFELSGHGFEIAGYIARTSLASAFQNRPAPLNVRKQGAKIVSRFQRRMVDVDLRKRAMPIICATDYDYLLIDLIDERFNLARFGGSNLAPDLFTLSREISGVCKWSGPIVVPGTNQHLAAWKRGVGRLLRGVDPKRVVVNCAYWATHLSTGIPLDNQSRIKEHNRYLEVMYGYLKRNSVGGVIEYPDGILADPEHRWGVAPFHYSPLMYEFMNSKLDEICGRQAHVRSLIPCSTES